MQSGWAWLLVVAAIGGIVAAPGTLLVRPLAAVVGLSTVPACMWTANRWRDLARPGELARVAFSMPPRMFHGWPFATPKPTGRVRRYVATGNFMLSGSVTLTHQEMIFTPYPIWRWAGFARFSVPTPDFRDCQMRPVRAGWTEWRMDRTERAPTVYVRRIDRFDSAV